MPGSWELAIRTSDGRSRNVPLGLAPVTIGRALTSDISYPEDAGLSRCHLIFEPRGMGWIVRDPGSKNGSRVNSASLVSEKVLSPGDCITAGQLSIVFRTPSPDSLTAESTHTSVVEFIPETGHEAESIELSLQDAPGTLQSTKAIQALVRVGQELSSHRPLPELFQLVIDLAKEAVGATRAVLMILENNALAPRAAAGDNFRISSAVRDRVLQDKASVLVRDALDDRLLAQRDSIVFSGVRSLMAVPLQVNARVTGLLYVDTRDFLQRFTEEDLSLLTVMANVAAIRIEHARLVEVEHSERLMALELVSAAAIQNAFLPSAAPVVPGWSIAGKTLPCLGVGGDYFDYAVHPDGRVTLLVADVAGKGMSAALLMSNMQAHAQASMEANPPPGVIMERLNKMINARCPGNRFITCFWACIDPRSGEVVYANAGHNRPVLVRADGTVEALDGGGFILGPLPGIKYENYYATLRPGDVLAIYTDGLTEACPQGSLEEFGEARVGAALTKGLHESSDAIANSLIAELTCWTAPDTFADDVTLIVAKRLLE